MAAMLDVKELSTHYGQYMKNTTPLRLGTKHSSAKLASSNQSTTTAWNEKRSCLKRQLQLLRGEVAR